MKTGLWMNEVYGMCDIITGRFLLHVQYLRSVPHFTQIIYHNIKVVKTTLKATSHY